MPRSERLTRHREGYITDDGYVLERCPGNQWNVWEDEDAQYPDGYISEGEPTIESALDTIRNHRASKEGS